MRILNLIWMNTARTLVLDSCCMTARQGTDVSISLKIEISGKLHSNPSLFKLYCSCLPVGTNPNAPLEIPISFSSWD